jgi:hypothetical protein
MFLQPLVNWFEKVWWDVRHPKHTLFVPEKKHGLLWGTPSFARRKEDPKTKKRRKMAEDSRKINRRK